MVGSCLHRGGRLPTGWTSLLVAVSLPLLSHADEPREAAATIGQDFVLVSEVKRELLRVINDRPVEPLAERVLQAKTLQQLVDRRLIVHWLKSKGQGVSQTELDLAIQRLEKRLEQRGKTLAQHLAELRTTEAELRRLFEWQIGWKRFLARYMTDENLQKFFEQHRRDFDGTKVHAAHILIKLNGSDLQAALEQARELRRRIAAKQLTFQEAAMRTSEAPTGAKGGDIGIISRREPMPESFSKAAFALAEGDVSEPVVTVFGVHLIHCLKIEPGRKRWQDVRQELGEAITLYLFTWAADRKRADTQVKFTGALPHFRPGTEQLAE